MSEFLNGFTLEETLGKCEMTRDEFNHVFRLVIPAVLNQDAVLGDPDDEFEEEIMYTNEDEIIGNTGFLVYYPMKEEFVPIYESKNGDNIMEQIVNVFHIID